MTTTLTFHGAAGTVTGSMHLIETPKARVLIDCGLFQGPKILKELNYRPFPFAPDKLSSVLLTHAHIDHSGLLPKLTKADHSGAGYRGAIHATQETGELLDWMLPDSAQIQEGEVDQLNRRRTRFGEAEVEPIYTEIDAARCLRQIKPVAYDQWVSVAPGIKARWWNAGHILGSASIELDIETFNPTQPKLSLLFSGDIGPHDPALQELAAAPKNLDYVISEATYGDRERPELSDEARRAELRREMEMAIAPGGNIVIPSFAIERSQELLSDLTLLMAEGKLPKLPVYLDSPLAIRATEVFERHMHNLAVEHGAPSPFRAPNIHFVTSVEQSQQLNRINGGIVIISASGMCEAGRVRHHLRNNLWRPEASVMIVGYQAPGTLGRLLEEGAPRVRIMGDEVAVKARIRRLELYSGHADRTDLLTWMKARLPVHKGIFLVHGEPSALSGLAKGIGDEIGEAGLPEMGPEAGIVIPSIDQRFEIDRVKGALVVPSTGTRLANSDAEAIKKGWDWHNELSAFSIGLNRRLADLASDRKRLKLIRELNKTIEKE